MRNRKRKRHLDGAENGDNKAAELNTVEGGRLDGSDENNKRKKHEYTAEGVNGGDLLTDVRTCFGFGIEYVAFWTSRSRSIIPFL